MFKTPTVVILGAGASHECGLPLGTALRDDIAHNLKFFFGEGGQMTSGDRALYDLLHQRYQSTKNDIFKTGNVVAAAARNFPSIDEVLHYFRTDDLAVKIGKLAIVYSILLAENRSKLAKERDTGLANFGALNGSWYDFFFSIAIS